MSAHTITVRRLESGYYHIRGQGPCNWAQPPQWPCDEETLRAHTFAEASEDFIRSALAARGPEVVDQPERPVPARCPECGVLGGGHFETCGIWVAASTPDRRMTSGPEEGE